MARPDKIRAWISAGFSAQPKQNSFKPSITSVNSHCRMHDLFFEHRVYNFVILADTILGVCQGVQASVWMFWRLFFYVTAKTMSAL